MSCPVFLQRGFCRGHWLKAALINHAQSSHRNAVVVSRQFEPKTYKEGERNWPFRPHLKRREYVYRLERVTTASPAGSMDVILTVDIEGMNNLPAYMMHHVLICVIVSQALASKGKL